MNNSILKASLATEIHYSYEGKEANFRDIHQFLLEETEDILQWIEENTSEEARKIILAVQNDNTELFKELINSIEETAAEEIYTTLVVEENIGVEVFLLLFLTRRDVKQFILSLIGDIKSTKVVPIVVMLIDLLQRYEGSAEFVKNL